MTWDGSEGHSAAFFDEQRDYWWNDDFLRLVVERLGLGPTRSVLDVGCGLGHWSRVLTRGLPALTEISGIDPEMPGSTKRALLMRIGVCSEISVVQGRGEQLPFPDGHFDLVTCQTVLIHVADVPAVLREMCRVTRPGGTVFVAEPNNLAGQLVRTSVSAKSEPEALASASVSTPCAKPGRQARRGRQLCGRPPAWLFRRGRVDYRGLLSLRQDIPAVAAVLLPGAGRLGRGGRNGSRRAAMPLE